MTVLAAALAPAAAAGQSKASMEAAAAAGAVEEAGQGQASYGPKVGRQQMQALGSQTSEGKPL